jgi:hypothetical protein
MNEFEKKLQQMSKPEIKNLQHEEVLSKIICNAKEQSVLSFWWMSIPVYIIALFIMKTFFMPSSTIVEGLKSFKNNNHFVALFLFVIVPLLLFVLNVQSIKKVYQLTQNISYTFQVTKMYLNLFVALLCIAIILVYFI